MTAEVETMMYVGEVPWHGFGHYVGDSNVDSDTAIQCAGLDWKVEKRSLTTPAADGSLIEIPTHRAVVRATDDKVLGVVGKGYGVFQNRDAFKFLDGLVDDGSLRYHTAGSLKDGKHIWILAQFDRLEVVKGDFVDMFLLLYNTHDGSKKIRALETATRVVCANTAQQALREGKGKGIGIRHTTHAIERLEEAKEVLIASRKRAKVFGRFAKNLAKFKFNGTLWTQFSETLFPQVIVEDGKGTKLGKTLRDNQRNKLTELFESGRGQEIKGVGGTAWAAYNATVEYANYFRGAAKKEGAQERRFESSLFGSGSEFIDKGVIKLADMLDAA